MKLRVLFIMLIVLGLYIIVQIPVNAEEMEPPRLNSEAVILVESETGAVLLEKNATKRMNPASLTKIATAIYAIENGNLEDMVKVSENAYQVVGSSVYLEIGEEISLRELLAGLLVNSGNDAGIAIAEHLSGNVEQFAKDLNHYLENHIGVLHTHFENPHGLYHPNHYTTAEDMARITQYAMENKVFRELLGIIELEWNGEKWDTTLYTHHKLLRERPYPGVTGGKTGYIEEAGYSLATTATRDNLELIAITLNTDKQDDSYVDTEALLDYGFSNFNRKGQHITAVNQVVDFRKIDHAKELSFQEDVKVAWKAKQQLTRTSHEQNVPIRLDTVPIKHYEIVIMMTLIVFIWLKFRYEKSQKL